jgi:hypothetical protein
MTEQSAGSDGTPSQAVTAAGAPQTRLDKILGGVPRALSSHAHIMFLGALGVYLVLLPLLGVNVSAKSELIGGNYTNVTSDLGACIAAGLTVHLVRRERKRTQELHELFAQVHGRHDRIERDLQRVLEASQRRHNA